MPRALPLPDVSPSDLTLVRVHWFLAAGVHDVVYHLDFRALDQSAQDGVLEDLVHKQAEFTTSDAHALPVLVKSSGGTRFYTPSQDFGLVASDFAQDQLTPVYRRYIWRTSANTRASHAYHFAPRAGQDVVADQEGFQRVSLFPNLVQFLTGLAYTGSGYLYQQALGFRMSFRRNQAEGGHIRGLTVQQAERYLEKHGITTVPANP